MRKKEIENLIKENFKDFISSLLKEEWIPLKI